MTRRPSTPEPPATNTCIDPSSHSGPCSRPTALLDYQRHIDLSCSVDETMSAERETIINELLDELTTWDARDRMGMFRKWLQSQVSLVHLHVLTVLEADGPLPMSKLADALDVSVASTTGIVDRMEQRGLVRRTHSREDRRVVLV